MNENLLEQLKHHYTKENNLKESMVNNGYCKEKTIKFLIYPELL